MPLLRLRDNPRRGHDVEVSKEPCGGAHVQDKAEENLEPARYCPAGRPGRNQARYIITHHNPKVLRPPPCWSPLDPRHMSEVF